MLGALTLVALLLVSPVLFWAANHQQDPPEARSPAQYPSPAASRASAALKMPKPKRKKVWTDGNLSEVRGTISVIGNLRSAWRRLGSLGSNQGSFAEFTERGNVTPASPPAYFATQEFACVEPCGIAVQDCGIPGTTANAFAVRQKSEGVSAMRELARAAILSKRFSGALSVPHPVCLALSL